MGSLNDIGYWKQLTVVNCSYLEELLSNISSFTA